MLGDVSGINRGGESCYCCSGSFGVREMFARFVECSFFETFSAAAAGVIVGLFVFAMDVV